MTESVVIEPSGRATASIIWLHGLGADGHDFEPVVHQLRLADAGIRVTLPHAPRRPVTINGGVMMRAWYDITDPDLTKNPDAAGIRHSARLVDHLIEADVAAGVPEKRIVLAGFSQGGAVSLHCGLRRQHALAGILALSTYLPLADTLPHEAQASNRGTPIFMGHGEIDPIVPLSQGHRSAELLKDMDYPVDFRSYPMPHSVCLEELRDMGNWLSNVLGLRIG
ncbi:MAG: alpha/beta fold hydrolase [Gammaproteobacteria bacterium]|nr:alpha/beta fold hydrolase [Gammaproteobacteria bacterium]